MTWKNVLILVYFQAILIPHCLEQLARREGTQPNSEKLPGDILLLSTDTVQVKVDRKQECEYR
jgi:hypothetical protein